MEPAGSTECHRLVDEGGDDDRTTEGEAEPAPPLRRAFFLVPTMAVVAVVAVLVVGAVGRARGYGSASADVEGVESKAAVCPARVFGPEDAKGGSQIDPTKTAVVFIEFQNEFATEKGKMHDAVKGVMQQTGMLQNSVDVAKAARDAGAKVFHVPISFAADGSDNPNPNLGILKGCHDGKLFTAGTWNAEICDAMKPQPGDVKIVGKRGLDAFPGTDLEEQLTKHGIETVALAGFLTDCCVESTMRTAYEKGYNVITLTDCTATTTPAGYTAATNGTFGMFSAPMTGIKFSAKLSA